MVEPLGHTVEGVRAMQAAGTVVLAYLSVMELAPGAPETRLLGDGDFLCRSGRRLRNEEYGNFLADLRSPRWRGLLLEKAARLLDHYDGLFLDTVADVEHNAVGAVLRDTLPVAAASLLKELRTRWPDHVLVQNNGLGLLSSWTAPLIHGICWENPCIGQTFWVQRLRALQTEHGLKVFLLLEAPEGQDTGPAEAVAAANGFLLYAAPSRYLGAVRPRLERQG